MEPYPKTPAIPLPYTGQYKYFQIVWNSDHNAALGTWNSPAYREYDDIYQSYVTSQGAYYRGYYETYVGYKPVGGSEIIFAFPETIADIPEYYVTHPLLNLGYEESSATPDPPWEMFSPQVAVAYRVSGYLNFHTHPGTPVYVYTDYYGVEWWSCYCESHWEYHIRTTTLFTRGAIKACPAILPILVPLALFAVPLCSGIVTQSALTVTTAGRRRKKQS